MEHLKSFELFENENHREELTIKIKGIGTICPVCGKGLSGINVVVGIAEDGELLPCKPNTMTNTEAELVTPHIGKVKFALVGQTCMNKLFKQGFMEPLMGRKSETKFYKKF
jgi:hypothetical protein